MPGIVAAGPQKIEGGKHLLFTGGMSSRAADAKLRASSVWGSGCWLPLPTTRYSKYWQVSSALCLRSSGSTCSAGSVRPCKATGRMQLV